MLKFFCTFLYLVLLCNCLLAQQTITGFKRFSKAEGVPNSSNNKIFEGSDHFLWLSTESGLYRFDGHQFTPFFSNSKDSSTLSSNSISDIEEDRFGNLWVGTFGKGINKLTKKTGKWKQYLQPTKDTNPEYSVFDILKDSRGQLWIGTGGRGLLLYNQQADSFEQFLPNEQKNKIGTVRFENEVRAISADVSDPIILWVACTDGLYKFNTTTKKFICYTYIKNGKADWINNSFHTIYVQNKETIWLGAWGGGLIRFNINTNVFTTYPYAVKEYAKYSLANNIVSVISYCTDSSLYISTAEAGLFEFNITQKSFTQLNKMQDVNGVASFATFNGITHTSDGSTWICSLDAIFQKNPVNNRLGKFQNFYQPPNKFVYKPSLSSVWYDKRNRQYFMSCNAGYGVYVFDANFKYVKSIAIEAPSVDKKFRDIVADASGTIWLRSLDAPYLYAYDAALDQFVNAATKIRTANFINADLQEMTTDALGNLWFVNKAYLYKYNPLNAQLQTFTINNGKSGLNNGRWQYVQLKFDKNKNPWLVTNLGLFNFDQEKNTWQHFYFQQNNKESLASSFVVGLAFDANGNYWIAPKDEGLQLYNPSTKKFSKHLIQAEGFFAQRVHSLVTDKNQDLWAATINGLAKYDLKQDRWFIFNKEDGLLTEDLFAPMFAFDNGTIVLAAQNGFANFHIDSLPLNKQKPIVYFNQFVSGGKEIAVTTKTIYLPYTRNELQIDYGAIVTIMGNRTKFYYKILPQQKEWISTSQRSISLAGFASGNYTLQIKAMNADGVESEVKELRIIVAHPFWKSWWFILLSICMLAAILYVVYHYRVQQIFQMQELRNSISRDLHDEIGSSVSSVNMLALVAKKQLGNEHPVTPLLSQIGQSAQNAGDSIDEIIWSINPNNDSAQETFHRLRKYLSDVFELHGIDYNISFPELEIEKKLSMQVRRDLWLIFKEATNNMVKYSKCTMAQIELKISTGVMQVKIEDNGVGFDVQTATAKNRNGLSNMKERVQKYKQSNFEIVSKINGGTILIFQIPVAL